VTMKAWIAGRSARMSFPSQWMSVGLPRHRMLSPDIDQRHCPCAGVSIRVDAWSNKIAIYFRKLYGAMQGG
jgi:hypothetical protein